MNVVRLQGIEALESYLDPQPPKDAEKKEEDPTADAASLAAGIAPAPPPVAATEPDAAAALDPPEPKPMVCKKGKCRPYDPTKDKVREITRVLLSFVH